MEKGYKILGNYIRLVDERNRDLTVTKLLGVSISKKFIPSIANIVGTDLSNYKIVRTGQFAYGPVTSRNGEKISIAYLDEEDCIISSSYTVFEVENKEELDPEYLMLWFSRSEFDRYARYKSHGSVREIFDWNELCMVELPVPDIEKQRKIVKAYKTITDRIDLKQKINDNLAAQCSCIMYEQYCSDIKNGNPWIKYTVQELIDKKFIDSPMDGNHGELHPKVSDYVATGIPFVMANNLSDGFVDLSQCAFITEKQAKTLRKGFARPDDVLLTHKATLGRTAIVPKGYEYIILTPQVTYYRVHKGLSNVYLRYYFESSYFQSTLEAFAGGGSTRAYIGITKQCSLPIYLPCESSMTILTCTLSKIEQVRVLNQMEIQQLIDVRNTLITQLSSY